MNSGENIVDIEQCLALLYKKHQYEFERKRGTKYQMVPQIPVQVEPVKTLVKGAADLSLT